MFDGLMLFADKTVSTALENLTESNQWGFSAENPALGYVAMAIWLVVGIAFVVPFAIAVISGFRLVLLAAFSPIRLLLRYRYPEHPTDALQIAHKSLGRMLTFGVFAVVVIMMTASGKHILLGVS